MGPLPLARHGQRGRDGVTVEFMDAGPRTFRTRYRRTRWWGRRRWDCQVIETGQWLGWDYRSRMDALRHVRDLREFESMITDRENRS